jgi:diguanylate cyclase (GGDEF)-like protein/PAS domain S-box-containing protein
VLNSPDVDQKFVGMLGIRSLLDFPLILKGEVIGDLTFHYHSSPIPFNDKQVEFARKLQISISLALENSRLLNKSKLSESKLKEAERLGKFGYYNYDVHTRKITCSEGLYHIFGRDPILGEPTVEEFIELYSVDPGLEAMQELVGNKETSEFDVKIQRDDGVLVFHIVVRSLKDDKGDLVTFFGTIQDITERKRLETENQDAREYAENIVETVREPLVVLGSDLKILTANHSFYDTFKVTPEETIGNFIYNLGNRQWDIPKLRVLFEEILPLETVFNGYEVEHDFLDIGRKVVLLNAREISRENIGSHIILLAMEDITERKRLEEIIKHQAHHDTLTGLPNRLLFMDFLALELAQARRNGKKLALLFLDLNGFKQVNDTLGHSYGDCLLQEVAKRLKACIRESDTVARLGGDEFTVMMPDLSQTDDLSIVLGKIRGVFETPFMLDDSAISSTTSIGVCMFPNDGESAEELMKKADTAMYAAKRSGGNSYQFYNAEINAGTIMRQKMEGFLRQAVGNGELELLFQPLVRSDTRGIIGAEALLRFRHPEQGLLTPDQFLAIAEDSGAIVPIGEWVIRNACEQAQAWNEKGYPLSVSVNLSNRQFHQPDLIEKTARILAETCLMPHQLGFDIMEKTIMEDIDFSLRSMQALTEMGVAITIDNFGVGSSSLHWIKKMSIQKIKIDKSFVINMSYEPDDLAVVNAVVALSHKLKMKVVANGVETEEQLSIIQQNGCDQLQGYVISEPLYRAEFEQMIAYI